MDPLVAALIGLIATGVGTLWRAFLRGDVVPGSLYREQVAATDRERKRGDKAETQAERNTEALEAVTATVRTSLESRARRRDPDE